MYVYIMHMYVGYGNTRRGGMCRGGVEMTHLPTMAPARSGQKGCRVSRSIQGCILQGIPAALAVRGGGNKVPGAVPLLWAPKFALNLSGLSLVALGRTGRGLRGGLCNFTSSRCLGRADLTR